VRFLTRTSALKALKLLRSLKPQIKRVRKMIDRVVLERVKIRRVSQLICWLSLRMRKQSSSIITGTGWLTPGFSHRLRTK
jgi:hypothetical protein